MRTLALTVLLASGGCTAAPARLPRPPSTAVRSSEAPPPIVFIEDDYPRALTAARAQGVPLFVDAWAPWCHTCLSMRAYVFPDVRLRQLAKRFVWLSIDTERDGNAAVVSKLDVRVLPTLFVVDSTTEQRVLAWPGSLTAGELVDLLGDADLSTAPKESRGEASAASLRGHRATARGDFDEAIADYRVALAAAPAQWRARPEALDALVVTLSNARRDAECVTTALDEAPHIPPGTALADVVRSAMGCAERLPKDAREHRRLMDLATLGERVASDPAQPILADDRSDLYADVVDALKDLGVPDEAGRVARAWASFLEGEAAAAPSPAARAVFDAHRLLAYGAIGEPQRALVMLERSERDFPDDYNPPARLASAYFQMKRYDDALGALHRALGRAYGPRKLRLWALEADILVAKGDAAGARRALRDALDFANTVPLTASYPKLRDALAKRLAELP